MTNREFFAKRWASEHTAFVRVMQALPNEKLDYRPHPRSRSAAELVWLLTLEEAAGNELIDTGQIDWKEPPPPAPPSLDEMIGAYQRHHGDLGARLNRVDDALWERKAKFIVNGQSVMEDTVGEFFWISLLDAIHHRGQLSAYIRPMGGKVPSIYGPSADDMGG